MTLKIYLDSKSFNSLKKRIPPALRSKVLLQKTVQLEFFGGFLITCNEAEARTLLLYGEDCPGVVKAFRLAGLPLEDEKKSSTLQKSSWFSKNKLLVVGCKK